MRTKSRSLRLLLTLLAAFALIAAACGDDDGDGDAGGDGGDGSDIRVGMVYDIGGRGDQSFNDAAYEGLTRAATELGVEVNDLEPAAGGENRAELLRTLAEEGYDLIIGVGFAFEEAILDVAGDFPDTTFAIVDAAPEADNIKGLVFAEEQGSFLVGAAAALTSETGHIGFIGGVEIPLIQKFEAGFAAGARHVNPDIRIDVSYITQPPDFAGFNDPARGGEIASSMYEAGADVVYHAAGGSGGGLFEAAASNGDVWAIGVDSDQYNTVGAPGNARILTSMLKRVDVAVFGAIEAFVNGDTEGGVEVFDLSVDGVGYSTSGGFVDSIAAQLDELKQQIVDGDIEVPDSP
jgi:basic membrane protein A and related proteins